MLSCIAIFPVEKGLFYHEWKSSARQSVGTFLLAYTVQEAAASIVASLVSLFLYCLLRILHWLWWIAQLFSLVMVFGIGLQHTGRIFVEFWFTIFCLLSTGESVGVSTGEVIVSSKYLFFRLQVIFSTFSNNGGLTVSLVSAGITLLSQLNGIISVTLPTWLSVIGW